MALHQKRDAFYFVFASGMIIYNTSRITGKFCMLFCCLLFFQNIFSGKNKEYHQSVGLGLIWV